MMYRLINSGPSPYGRKVAIAMREKQIPFEVVYDLPWADAKETRRYSPLEQLPILLTDEEEAIFDSSFILDWLEWTHPDPALLPQKLPERIEARRLQVLGERLMEVGQTLIFEHHRPEPAQGTVDRQVRKLASGLAAAEKFVLRDPIATPLPHLGQIALATTLLVWEFVIEQEMVPPLPPLLWRTRYPAITKLVGELENRESFLATAPRPMPVDFAGETQ